MERIGRVHNQTADERRDAIIDAAIVEFARGGLHGTATEDIARRAGISQPYVFRLFNTKRALFLAAAGRVYERLTSLFLRAAEEARATGVPVLEAMGTSYNELLSHREELLMLLQMFAASDDAEVQAIVGEQFERLYHLVQEVGQVDEIAARQFFAVGMLCTVVTALDRPRMLGYGDWDTYFASCADRGGALFRGMWQAPAASREGANSDPVDETPAGPRG